MLYGDLGLRKVYMFICNNRSLQMKYSDLDLRKALLSILCKLSAEGDYGVLGRRKSVLFKEYCFIYVNRFLQV